MKIDTPEISWHSRQPIYSLDIQPGNSEVKRLATASTDANVRIWLLKSNKDKTCPEFLANLNRHTKPVNVVRFSPDGQLLASGADDGLCILWKLHETTTVIPSFGKEEGEEDDKETWNAFKTLRGHFEDIYDVSWSADSSRLVTGSVDNTAIIWDSKKGDKIHLFKDHRSFVQGVAWDPLNHFCATISCDRSMRIYSLQSYRCVYNVSRFSMQINNNDGQTQTKQTRMFHDDSMKSFFRRLCYTPDGQLLIVPSGCIESGDALVNTTFVFSRLSYSKPVLHLPGPSKATVAVRCCPLLFKLRTPPPPELEPEAMDTNEGGEKADIGKEDKTTEGAKPEIDKIEGSKPVPGEKPDAERNAEKEQEPNLFDLPYRMVFAVAAEDSILLYDTQQSIPFAYISNIHYTTITDISWASDGSALAVCSTDGYITVISFESDEIGEKYMPPQVTTKAQITKDIPAKPEQKSTNPNKEAVIAGGKVDTVSKDAQILAKENAGDAPPQSGNRVPRRMVTTLVSEKPDPSGSGRGDEKFGTSSKDAAMDNSAQQSEGPRRIVTTLVSGGSSGGTGTGPSGDNKSAVAPQVAKNPVPRRVMTTMLSGDAGNSTAPGPSSTAGNQHEQRPAVTAQAVNKPRRINLTTLSEPQKE